MSIGQILKVQQTDGATTDSGNTYTIKAGDSLWKIAQKYNTTVEKLKDINSLTSNNLTIGQKLTILAPEPSGTETQAFQYTVKAGDSLWTIANKFGTTVNDIKNASNITSNNLSIGQVLNIPTNSQYRTYTVIPGDTLYYIALRNRTSVDKIKSLNNLSTNNLMIGQKLLLPN